MIEIITILVPILTSLISACFAGMLALIGGAAGIRYLQQSWVKSKLTEQEARIAQNVAFDELTTDSYKNVLSASISDTREAYKFFREIAGQQLKIIDETARSTNIETKQLRVDVDVLIRDVSSLYDLLKKLEYELPTTISGIVDDYRMAIDYDVAVMEEKFTEINNQSIKSNTSTSE